MASNYTPDQLEAYLQRIGYKETGLTRLQQAQASKDHDALATLAELQRRHLGSIPWGNSAIHYSQHHSISTHPAAVFEKLVIRRHDGYCMENTYLFYIVLRSLGYQVYPSAGRVSSAAQDPKNAGPEVEYNSLSHMVIIATINDRKFMVDVGFGNNVPTRPLLIEENAHAVNIAPTEMRLVKEPLPGAVDQSQKFWIYQIRFNSESRWVPIYAFFEMEYLPQDFAMMNVGTSKLPSSWFTQKVVCIQQILDEEEDDLVGLYIMGGTEVKRRLYGKTEVVQNLENEEDRVKAMEKWFGIRLSEHEVAGIRGLGSELR